MMKRVTFDRPFFNSRREILVGLFLVISTLAVYWQVRNHEFLNYDDTLFVTQNRHVQAGLTREGITFVFTNPDDVCRKLSMLSHMVDCELFGLDAGWHHLTNLFFHIANAVLLFLALSRMTGAIFRSAFVAALFALHPINVESVAWVAERRNVLSTFFWMLTLLTYARYAERPGLIRYLVVFLCFGLGLISKPMLVTLPFVLLLMDYWPLCRIGLSVSGGEKRIPVLRLVLEKVPLMTAALYASLLTFSAVKRMGGMASFKSIPLKPRVENALVSYVTYIGKMIWPQHLAVFYPYPAMQPGWQVIGASLLLVFISLIVFWTLRRHTYLTVGWLWYIGTLVPVIGLVQTGSQAIADRYAYIPLIGVFIIIAWGVPDLVAGWRHKKIGLATAVAVLLSILMPVTWLQVRYWKNSITLFDKALDVTTNNYIAHNGLAVALAKEGKTAEAVRHYREALLINPYFAEAHNNLGLIFSKLGRTAEAVSHYSEALRLNPDYVKAHNNLGAVLVHSGDIENAIVHFRKALDISPDYAEAHNNLGIALAEKGRITEAISHYTEALRINPDYVEAHDNLGNALAKQGRIAEAIRHYTEALRIDPDYVEAHNNLGAVLFRSGKIDQAIVHFREALRIRPGYVKANKNLKRVLAAKGKLNEAFAKIQEELKLQPESPLLYCRLGELYKRTGDLDKAIGQYQSALSIDPTFVRALNNLGILYSAKMEYDKALSLFKKIIELQPEGAGPYYNIACIYARQKKAEESIDWLKKAIENGYDDWKLIKTDKDLDNIRGSEYYKELVREN
jgi:tetratricopeptide (TPR) repeat protein